MWSLGVPIDCQHSTRFEELVLFKLSGKKNKERVVYLGGGRGDKMDKEKEKRLPFICSLSFIRGTYYFG